MIKNLLTVNNPKTLKGEKKGYCTAILHLSPASESGRNVCSHSTAGCRAACLNKAGRGGIGTANGGTNVIQECRKNRTRFYFDNKEGFLLQLEKEITAFIKRCKKYELIPCVRLNGTSDLAVEKWGLMEKFPDIQWYDYTKSPERMLSWLDGKMPKNYHLTFSRSECNESACQMLSAKGANVAVVFNVKKGKPLPPTFYGVPVIDGDVTDLRFLDPHGVVVGLRFKYRYVDMNKRDGFIIDV